MMNRSISKCWLLLFSLGLICARIAGKGRERVIMFDLGGTLATVDWWYITKQLGILDATRYFVKHRSTDGLRQQLYQLLETVYGSQGTEEGACVICDESGRPQPLAIVGWFTGTLSSADIMATCQTNLIKRSEGVETRLLGQLVETLFSPQSMAASLKPLPGALNLLEDLTEAGYRVMIVSNIAAEVYEEFLNTDLGQQLLTYVKPKDFIISGIVGAAKPDLRIFHKACAQAQIKPEQVVFVDDQEENIAAAASIGMKTVRITGKIAPVRRALRRTGISI